ncbi:undecaprenyl-diphosphate phosphatase [Clostridioides difficile]
MESIFLIIKSIILGVIEGITEFLPISSTGHMIIVENLIDFKGINESYVEMYTYVIQLGAILAVVVLYWDKIKDTLIYFFPKKTTYEKCGFRFWFMIFIACIPGAVLGILFDDMAEQYLFSPVPVAITLFLGGILMIYMENVFRNNKIEGELSVTVTQAFVIGLCQCLAIIPGMSRSASTIIGGWMSGLSTVAAAEFSFYLAIPVMVGMSFLKIFKIGGLGVLSNVEIISLGVGFIVSFIVALIVIKRFIDYLKKKPMKVFAVYRIIFAVIVLIAGLFGIFN